MKWFRRSAPPRDIAERFRGRGPGRASGRVPVADVDTVRGWVRELAADDVVLVHRPWGTLSLVVDRKHGAGITMVDSEGGMWIAHAPGGREPLSPGQIEHIVTEALTSSQRPTWPEWTSML